MATIIPELTLPAVKGDIVLELKAGLLKNQKVMAFGCQSLGEARKWYEQLSPLFDWNLMDESAVVIKPYIPTAEEAGSRDLQANLATSPGLSWNTSTCPREPPRLDGHYWSIYSKEPPCGHEHE